MSSPSSSKTSVASPPTVDASSISGELLTAEESTTNLVQEKQSHRTQSAKVAHGDDSGSSIGDTQVTPGALAIPGNSSSTSQGPPEENVDNLADNTILEEDTHSSSTPMMVEATAVQEIIATQVIVESESTLESQRTMETSTTNSVPQVPLQRVDIDDAMSNMEEGSRSNAPSNTKLMATEPRGWPPICRVLSIVVGILVFFLSICVLVFALGVPREHEAITVDEEEAPCEHAIQETIFHLEQMAGKGWIEFTLASAVVGVLLYHILDEIQDRYCAARPNPQGMATGEHFYYNMIVAFLEVFWFFTVIVQIICFNMEDLQDPHDLIVAGCIDTVAETPWQAMRRFKESSKETFGDLNGYYIALLVKIPLLIFLLVSRGRLLLNNKACQHITIGWRRFWFWLKVAIELGLFLLSIIGMLQWLLPMLDQIQSLYPPNYSQ